MQNSEFRQSRLRVGPYLIVCILNSAFCISALTAGAATDSPLIAAAKRGDEAAVRNLLRNRDTVNTPGPDGGTALYWAARGDHLGIVRLLLSAGARVEAADRYGITPLALAAINGSAPVVSALLTAGADAKGRVGDGETVLMAAARTGRVDAAKLLLDRGADPNARASIRKRLPGARDKSVHEWTNVTPLGWGRAFHEPSYVSPPAMRLIAERGGTE